MTLIVGLVGLWLILSVLAIGMLYIGSAHGKTEAGQTAGDWEQFE